MRNDIIFIAIRVLINCVIFASFLFIPFKSRFRYSYIKTAALTIMLTLFTVAVTIVFLSDDFLLSKYSTFGIIMWIFLAFLTFSMAIKGSYFEILFIVLVVLNLYVNIAAIAKVIMSVMHHVYHFQPIYTLITIGILIIYIPLLWFLIAKLYKQVIEFNINFSFWRFIWVIPALVYMIFFVKIISDYWKLPYHVGTDDVAFIILWSFTSYVLFCITLLMLIQTYKGITAIEQKNLITSQLKMQESQYERLLNNMERTARLRHDWRHHLLSISSFAQSGSTDKLQEYIQELIPEYVTTGEEPLCANHIVEVILQHNAAIARAQGVTVEIKADIAKNLTISDTDMCIIFGNLTENALEACLAQESGSRAMEIKAEMMGRQLILMIKNTYSKQVISDGSTYYSTKHQGVGLGISSVKKVVEKNNGFFKVEYNKDNFMVYVLLNVL